MRMDQSPIFTEDGTALYRFAYLAAKELLETVQKWRNTIESSRPADYSRAQEELRTALYALELWLCPPVQDGVPIDPRDTPGWRDLPGVSEVNIREQFARARSGVCSGLGFSSPCAHEIVCELAMETLRAVIMLGATKDRATLDYLLGPRSPLRSNRGIGPIDQEEAEQLEAECLVEAEKAWRESQPPRDGGGGGNQPKQWNPTKPTLEIIALMKKGLSNDQVMERLGCDSPSNKNIRQIRSRAIKWGYLPDHENRNKA